MEYIPHTYSGSVAGTVIAVDATGPQNIRFLTFLNTTAAVAYLQIFNLPAASVTIGTTAPKLSIGIPASAAIVIPIPEGGLNLAGSGLSLGGTTTRAGLTGASLDVNLGWGN